MSNTLKWSLSFGFITAMIVFFSSLYVNSLVTSLFRASFVFFLGLFIGLVFQIIWGFIQMDIKENRENNHSELDKLSDEKSINTTDNEIRAEKKLDEEATH